MNADRFKTIRHALGLSADQLAKLVGVSDGRTIRRWEAEDRDIPGPVAVLLEAIMDSKDVRAYFKIKGNA